MDIMRLLTRKLKSQSLEEEEEEEDAGSSGGRRRRRRTFPEEEERNNDTMQVRKGTKDLWVCTALWLTTLTTDQSSGPSEGTLLRSRGHEV